MGAKNAGLVYQNWAHLDHRPVRLLVAMALTTLDSDREPTYWGGREAMASALGYSIETAKAQTNAYRQVQKTLAELIAVGAVERASGPTPRANARYRLNLHDPNRCPSGSPEQVTLKDHNRCPSGTEQVSLRDQTGDPQGHPEEKKEQRGTTLYEGWGATPSAADPTGWGDGWGPDEEREPETTSYWATRGIPE